MSASLALSLLLMAAPAVLLLHAWLSLRLRRQLRALHAQHAQERSLLIQQLREDFGQLLSALHAEVLVAQRTQRAESLDAMLQISVSLKLCLRSLLRQLDPDRDRSGLTMPSGPEPER